MTAALLRLGDVIDDYCPRCKLLLNHAVASMVDGTVVKVVCQTCHTEHPFKNAVVPPKKKAAPKATLMDQVLAKIVPGAAAAAAAAPAEPVTEESTLEPAAEPAPEEPPKKRPASPPARYITRHATRPPKGKR